MAPTQDALYAELDLDLSWSEQRPPGARADEARPPPAPVPRQVHPAARRGAARPLRGARRARARPVLGLGDDARAVARERLRRGRGGRGGVQLPARARQDGAVRPVRARARAARRAARARASPEPPNAYVRRWFAPQAVDGAARLPLGRRRLRARGRAAGRPRAGGPLGAPDDALRPRLPARAAVGPYWCHKHRRECRPVERRAPLPRALRERHAAPDQGVRAGTARGFAAEVVHGDARELELPGRSTPS